MTRYVRAYHDSGPRPASAIRHIVLHSTEGGSADSVARMFSRASATASTHFVVDDSKTVRMLPDLVTPWGAPGANLSGLHVEQCGFAAWPKAEWMRHQPELCRTVDVIAKWAFHFGIPLTHLTPSQLRVGRRGVVTHKDCSVAFQTPGGHTDPGPGYPIGWVLAKARKELAGLEKAHRAAR